MIPVVDLCEGALPVGPVAAYVLPGDLGAARRICPRDELAVAGGAVLVADAAHFYGHIVATGTLSGSLALDDRTELFFRAEAVRMDSILGAIPASSTGPGLLAIGGTRVLSAGSTAAHARLVLPTAVGVYQNGHPFGLDVGVGFNQRLAGRLYAHEDATLLGQVVFGGGTGALRGGISTLAGIEWRAGRAFGLVADVHAGFGFADAVDDVSVAPGFRVAGGKHFGAELSLMVPLVGRDRSPLAAANLGFSWRI